MAIRTAALEARKAGRVLAGASRAQKDAGLREIAQRLRASVPQIVEKNALDLARGRAAGLSPALLDRLTLDAPRIEAMAEGVEFIAGLSDPVGSRSNMQRLPNGLLVGKQRIPLGVIAMIYEARPNVTVDAAALCLKAGNACLLRGGKEAESSNQFLGGIIRGALEAVGLPGEAVFIVPATDREGIKELISLTGLIDLAIPRGGEGLIRFVHEHAKVPTVEHYQGVCHLYVDMSARSQMASELVLNGKLQRPGVCNALECVLVHEEQAPHWLPELVLQLKDQSLELRACEASFALLKPSIEALGDGASLTLTRAQPEDFGREFLSNILALKQVGSLDEALDHVARYGSNHTEAICTENYTNSQRWLREVDASCVLVNASTRFNDGGQLGLGAEIGISTSKLHAYGPMGIESLTTEKWVVLGDGQVRS